MCRRILDNQHKIQNILQQQLRLCSWESVRTKPSLDDDDTSNGQMKTMPISSAEMRIKPQPIEHSPDVGQLFSVIKFS